MNSDTHTLQSHFEGRAPAVRETYDRLLEVLRTFGPVIEEAKKTSIHLVRSSALAGVATRKSHLILTLKADHAFSSPRVFKQQQVSARRFHPEIKLASPAEVDDELVSWLREAWALAG